MCDSDKYDGYFWDLTKDPTETDNLYGHGDYADIQKTMAGLLSDWQWTLINGDTTDSSSATATDEWEKCGYVCKYFSI